MNSYSVCPNCFKVCGEYEVCPHCGFSLEEDKREPYHLPTGTVLEGRYYIGRILGSGGFGITYKAWDKNLGMAVAVKEFYPTSLVTRQAGTCDVIIFGGDEQREENYRSGRARFLDEAQNMAKFRQSPDIVEVFGYFMAHNTAYIVMEFLDGITLKKYLSMVGGKLSYSDTVAVMRPIMSALEELHSKHILHRDISPDNIILTVDSKVKLIDFGAARFTSDEKESTLTAVIKPGYAPPEQYQSKGKQGPYTDIYALGATVYRTMVGEVPEESIDRALEDEVQRPSAKGIELPLNAEKAVMKAMAIKPGLRFQRVAEMKKAFLDNKNIDFPEIEFKKRRRRRLVSALSILMTMVLIVTMGLGYYFYLAVDAARIGSDSITVWLPAEDESLLADYYNVTQGFLSIEGNEKFTVNLVAVPPAEYETRLLAAAGSEEFPDVFRHDMVSAETAEQLAADVGLYYFYFNAENYYFIAENQKELKEQKCIPVCFTVPVAYANLGLLAKIGEEAPQTIADPAQLSYDMRPLIEKDTAHYSAVMQPQTAQLAAEIFGTKAEALPSADVSARGYSDVYSAFACRDALFYLGSSTELALVQSTDSLRGSYAVIPFDAETIYVNWGAAYSINNDSSLNRKRLAMLYISYLSATATEDGMPLERTALQNYIQANSNFLGFMLDGEEQPYISRCRLEGTAADTEPQADAGPAESEEIKAPAAETPSAPQTNAA